MLALLPPGELDGMLFKAHFLKQAASRHLQPRGGSRLQQHLQGDGSHGRQPLVCIKQPPGRQQEQPGGDSCQGGLQAPGGGGGGAQPAAQATPAQEEG